jgi:hypothetical protein
MKMDKHLFALIFLLSIVILSGTLVLAAETTEMKNTSIDYTPYREIVVNEPGVIYQIKITNTGNTEKTYEVTPAADVIRNLGTYRIDPSDRIILKPGEQQTFYFYLAVEKTVAGRTAVPIKITSGSSETILELVARPIGPFMPTEKKTGMLATAFKVVLTIILVIIIIIALILGFRRARKNKEEPDEDEPEVEENVETYY